MISILVTLLATVTSLGFLYFKYVTKKDIDDIVYDRISELDERTINQLALKVTKEAIQKLNSEYTSQEDYMNTLDQLSDLTKRIESLELQMEVQNENPAKDGNIEIGDVK